MAGGERYEGQVVAGPGGVMTDEVGVITGDLTLATELHSGQAVIRVQYTGAGEWYVVTGSPLPVTTSGSGQQLHQAILHAITQGLPEGLTATETPS